MRFYDTHSTKIGIFFEPSPIFVKNYKSKSKKGEFLILRIKP